MIQQEISVYERKLLKRKCIGFQYPRCRSSYRFDHVNFETPSCNRSLEGPYRPFKLAVKGPFSLYTLEVHL